MKSFENLSNQDDDAYRMDIKIKSQSFRIQELERESQFLICEQKYKSDILKTLKNQQLLLKNNNVLSKVNAFSNVNDKIKQQISATISNDTKNLTALQQKNETKCKQSQHLLQIFNQKSAIQHKSRIEELNKKRNQIYSKIEIQLQKDQPYMADKILMKIKKQAKRQAKVKIIKLLQKEIEKNNAWILQNTKKTQEQQLKKQIEEQILRNLQRMKQIMNKKININDQIYTNFGAQSIQIQKYYDKIDQIYSLIDQKYKSGLKYLSQKSSQSQINRFQMKSEKNFKKKNSFSISMVEDYFNQINELMEGIQQNQKFDENLMKCEQLNTKLSQMTRSK